MLVLWVVLNLHYWFLGYAQGINAWDGYPLYATSPEGLLHVPQVCMTFLIICSLSLLSCYIISFFVLLRLFTVKIRLLCTNLVLLTTLTRLWCWRAQYQSPQRIIHSLGCILATQNLVVATTQHLLIWFLLVDMGEAIYLGIKRPTL